MIVAANAYLVFHLRLILYCGDLCLATAKNGVLQLSYIFGVAAIFFQLSPDERGISNNFTVPYFNKLNGKIVVEIEAPAAILLYPILRKTPSSQRLAASSDSPAEAPDGPLPAADNPHPRAGRSD